MSYEIKQSDVMSFVSFFGSSTRQRGEELEFKRCPRCSGGGHDDWTFSLNTKTGAFCCQRASCGYKGHFVQLCRDFDFPIDFGETKNYRQLPQPKKKIEPKEKAIEYLASRGISKAVAEKYEITVSRKDSNVLVFPFYNEKGKLVFLKYRNAKFKKGDRGNKEWCEKDTMPILFGMKQCEGFGRLIITEGQLDSLSVAEAGFSNAVSVPTGANGFTWWIPCKQWIEKFQEIVVFGDYEKGKITLLDGLMARVSGKIKVVRKVDYLGEKDANDILRKYGPEAIKDCIENAEVPRIDNVKELADVQSVDLNSIDCIKTDIWSLDKAIKGLCMGTLTLLTGKRGEGKSTFASQIICSALQQGETVFAYSGELPDYFFKRWLDYQLSGKKYLIERENEYGETEYDIPDDVINRINAWYRGRMFIYDNNYLPPDGQEMESIVDTVDRVINQYGARLIVIDNLMTAMDEVRDQNNLYLAQSNFVGKLKRIALKYSVAILLIAHPKKTQGDIGNDDVSGSSDITNKVDTVLAFAKSKPKIGGEAREYDNVLSVTKNRLKGVLLYGEENSIKLAFSTATKRIGEIKHCKVTEYGWETFEPYEQIQVDEFINDENERT